MELLACAVFGRPFSLHPADPPIAHTIDGMLIQWLDPARGSRPLPATDGTAIWLPPIVEDNGDAPAVETYRIMLLQQAVRAVRGGVEAWMLLDSPLQRAVFQLCKANAADAHLVALLPGVSRTLHAHRRRALASRPPLNLLPARRRPLEALLQDALRMDPKAIEALPVDRVLGRALQTCGSLPESCGERLAFGDWWTGEFRSPRRDSRLADARQAASPTNRGLAQTRGTRMREVTEDERGDAPERRTLAGSTSGSGGAPMPIDRTCEAGAPCGEQPGLQAAPVRPRAVRDILLPAKIRAPRTSDTPAAMPALPRVPVRGRDDPRFSYPEWDHRRRVYLRNGATVIVQPPDEGSREWVEETLAHHHALLTLVRRGFEMLAARRTRLRRRIDGDDIDLDAYIAAVSDLRAGRPMAQALYQDWRRIDRNLAISILVDVSSSTGNWISTRKRVIDVEREALLTVAVALDRMAEPFALQAFSGVGPHGVTIRDIKRFDEPFSPMIARRIASLQPDMYTRAGAAIRHATAGLVSQPVRHRMLLMLSDGKPNDIDDYDGQRGLEDVRLAVLEAKRLGIHPFCLTVDDHAPSYLPGVFGRHQYGMLPSTEALPSVLLTWMKRLLRA